MTSFVPIPTSMLERLTAVEEKFSEMSSTNFMMSVENEILQKKVKQLENDNKEVYKSLTAIEKEISLLAQYGRRENIEIIGTMLYLY